MSREIINIYNDLERLRKLNNVLSDINFFEQRGYNLEDVPDVLFDLSFPVKNPLPLMDQNSGNVLDMGCGSGLDMYLIKKYHQNKKVYGTDISIRLLIEARRVSNELVCADIAELPFKSGVFSIVIMNGVFNLISDKKKMLEEVNRVLSDKGSLIIADIYKSNDTQLSYEADLFNLGKAMTIGGLFDLLNQFSFKYEYGEYEKEVVPDFGIFIMKWRKK